MNKEFKDFIGKFENVYHEDYCKHLIQQFELLASNGIGSNRLDSENTDRHIKNDYQIGINLVGHNLEPFNDIPSSKVFFDGLQECFNQYVAEYSILRSIKITGSVMKMQRTDPGGGYHVWHGEQAHGEHSGRILVYSLYLNTLAPENAGETEFLYQKTRILPVENTMIIWPAAFTHAHRGNTVFGEQSKYIVTGWFYCD